MPPSPPAFHPRHLEKGAPRWRLPSLRRTSLRQCLAGALKQRAELQCFAMLRSQARQRAVLLYLCTFNFETHRAVPLLRRNQIYDVQNVYEILRLWDPPSLRVACFRRSSMDWTGLIVARRTPSSSHLSPKKH